PLQRGVAAEQTTMVQHPRTRSPHPISRPPPASEPAPVPVPSQVGEGPASELAGESGLGDELARETPPRAPERLRRNVPARRASDRAGARVPCWQGLGNGKWPGKSVASVVTPRFEATTPRSRTNPTGEERHPCYRSWRGEHLDARPSVHPAI